MTAPLPEGVRLLHIGPHKTGSTAIQVALFEARDQLAAYGTYVPRGRRRRSEASEELFAARPTFDRPLPLWTALTEEVAAAEDLRVCVSDELFGKARARAVRKIAADLGGDRAHVLAVARRYDAYLPSQWQQRIKAGRTESYEDWLRILFSDERHWEKQNVWAAHDTDALVRRWVRHVGPDRFTLVVGDETDRQRLPRVFEELLDLPHGLLVIDPTRSNQSLAYADVELMRRVNAVFEARGVERSTYRGPVNRVVDALVADGSVPKGPRKPSLPGWASDRVRELSAARVDVVRALGVQVLGDPEHLRHTDDDSTGVTTPVPDDDFVADLVGRVVATMSHDHP